MSLTFKWFAVLLLLVLLPVNGFTHGGGLDGNGGHYNRKTGVYHQHRQPSTGLTSPDKPSIVPTSIRQESSPSTSSSSSSLVSQSERSQKINEYFRSSNENVGALSCGVVIYERNVDSSTKQAIRSRDGNRCVICGSTNQLEVDHMRGLQNGGSNDESNLATLCDDCHTEKTKMDSSLRRKREQICRGT